MTYEDLRELAAKIADPWEGFDRLPETAVDKAVVEVRERIAAAIRAIPISPPTQSGWKPGDPRCVVCDNGIEKDWVACPHCAALCGDFNPDGTPLPRDLPPAGAESPPSQYVEVHLKRLWNLVETASAGNAWEQEAATEMRVAAQLLRDYGPIAGAAMTYDNWKTTNPDDEFLGRPDPDDYCPDCGSKDECALGCPSRLPITSENDPLFDAIWNTIKGWDISRHNDGVYHAPTGDDVRHICDAIQRVCSEPNDNAFNDACARGEQIPGVTE